MSPTRGERLRRIGWLLTPLVVWAASFCGAWLGAVLAARFGGPYGGVGLMAGGAIGATAIAMALWIALLRRGLSGPPRTAGGGETNGHE